ncbi:hypothetical protein HLB23_28515 [Nocardia uniformis]|uniref:Uncharacterized protein n=1 Tax=Nocardia uniformis TaxID=53432 RepID=A0A849C544_9NOCA|nr:hypothetical protein [Nocardia uniformis]NNH73752.1 hypothetical protein [Nocardia uniformis]
MRETGTVQVDHQQFVLAHPETDTLDTQHEGTLLRTGPGFVTILTGIAYGPTTLTLELDDTPPIDDTIDVWDAVEEAVIESGEPLQVLTLDGNPAPGFDPIAPGRYRVCAHARGRDTDWGLEVTEPTESYWLRLWPTPNTDTGVRALHKADAAYSPPAKTIPQPDQTTVTVFAADGSAIRVPVDSPEAAQVHEQNRNWGGRPPRYPDAAISATSIGGLDRALIDELEELPPDRQRILARWCVRRAFEQAGLDRVPDFAEALDAMDEDRTPPKDFANGSLLRHRIDTDPAIPLTISDGLPGAHQHILQHTAMTAYVYTAIPDPLKAMFTVVSITATTYGMNYQQLFDRIRDEFLPDPGSS